MTLFITPIIFNNQEQGKNYATSNADVYVRGGPSSQYYAIGVINKGDTVLLLEPTQSSWRKIQYKDITGYTSGKFLEDIQIETPQLEVSRTSLDYQQEETRQSNFLIGITLTCFFLLIIYLTQNSGKQNKSKSITSLLVLFGGTFGLHRFYLGQVWRGILSILFFWTFIPTFISVIDFIYFLVIGESKFDEKYNNKKRINTQNSQKSQIIEEKDNVSNSYNKPSLNNLNTDLKEAKIKSASFSITNSEVNKLTRDLTIEPNNEDIIDIKREEINLNIESEEFGEVPSWPHQYVYSYEAINSASNSHRKFYERYKSNFHNGNLLDIRGNTNYAFVLYFDLLNEFEKHQNIQKLETQFLFLEKSCPKTKSYSLYALIDILRSRSDYNSLELLKKLESPTYQHEAGDSDYDPNAYKLGTQYKSKSNLNKDEIELLNKFYNPSNMFNSVEGCCVAIIEQYLKVISAVENDLLRKSSSLNEEISRLQILVKEHFQVGDNFYELKYINERVESETFLTIFKRVENSVRTVYDHKRKISDVFPYSENKLNGEFEERIGRILDKQITAQQPNIQKPDIPTQIKLNSQNVNRWKSEFDVLKKACKNEKLEKFYDGIDHLEEVSQKNSNIKHIFYQASETIAKYNKTQALKYYAKYISYDLNSDKIHNKQLTKTVQKSLFKSESQIVSFRQIIQELFDNNNLEQVLSKLDDFYKPVRKKIVLNKNEIQEAENKHSTTVGILNKYLVNDDSGTEEEVNLLDSEEELSISFNQTGLKQSKFIDNLRFNKTQEELLLTIAQNEFSIFQQEVEKIALKNGILKNQLIDSINKVCFDFLEGEVLIEEDEEYYIIEKSYYQEIIKE